MATSRYSSTPLIELGKYYGTSDAVTKIRKAIADGTIPYQELIVRGKERLDTISGEVYGDAKYWWVLAASSNVGWGLQIPPGTVVKIVSLSDVLTLVAR